MHNSFNQQYGYRPHMSSSPNPIPSQSSQHFSPFDSLDLDDDEFESLFGEAPSQLVVQESPDKSPVEEVAPVKQKYVKKRQPAKRNDKDVTEPWTPNGTYEIDMHGFVSNDSSITFVSNRRARLNLDSTLLWHCHIRAIRILIVIATYYDYEIWQMDVKTAFLNGQLAEEKASMSWNKRVDEEIKKFGVTQNSDEPYVKSYLGKCFAMKDLGESTYILGIKIYKDGSRRLIGLCPGTYIEKILKRFQMKNSKRRSIPMQEKPILSKSQVAFTLAEVKCMQRVSYASVMGSIMYAILVVLLLVMDVHVRYTLVFQQHQDEPIYDAWTRFKNLIKRVPHHGLDLWSLTQFFYDHVDDYTRMDLDFAADGNLRELSGEEAWEAIENFAQGQKEWDNPPNIISEQEVANLKAQAKRLFGNEDVWVEMHRGIAWDKVENSDPQSTPQVLPSFEEYTPPFWGFGKKNKDKERKEK
ncbi:hypothetical protein Tco_0442405 [Tanacetum coccineum]